MFDLQGSNLKLLFSMALSVLHNFLGVNCNYDTIISEVQCLGALCNTAGTVIGVNVEKTGTELGIFRLHQLNRNK